MYVVYSYMDPLSSIPLNGLGLPALWSAANIDTAFHAAARLSRVARKKRHCLQPRRQHQSPGAFRFPKALEAVLMSSAWNSECQSIQEYARRQFEYAVRSEVVSLGCRLSTLYVTIIWIRFLNYGNVF